MTAKRIWIGFVWVSAIGIALASVRWFVIPFELGMEHMSHYRENLSLSLYRHIFFGPLALALVPFQFWKGLRAKRPQLHRLPGYIYAFSILIAGVSSIVMLPAFKGTFGAAIGFALLGNFWILATARAVQLARSKRIAEHRRWMIRSAGLTFAAVVLRLVMPFLMLDGMTIQETYSVTAWVSWVPTMFVLEWWLRRR